MPGFWARARSALSSSEAEWFRKAEFRDGGCGFNDGGLPPKAAGLRFPISDGLSHKPLIYRRFSPQDCLYLMLQVAGPANLVSRWGARWLVALRSIFAMNSMPWGFFWLDPLLWHAECNTRGRTIWSSGPARCQRARSSGWPRYSSGVSIPRKSRFPQSCIPLLGPSTRWRTDRQIARLPHLTGRCAN